jgi:hypothetical protein
MADHHASTNLAEHEATYRGFLTLLKFAAAASLVSLLLLYYFLAL